MTSFNLNHLSKDLSPNTVTSCGTGELGLQYTDVRGHSSPHTLPLRSALTTLFGQQPTSSPQCSEFPRSALSPLSITPADIQQEVPALLQALLYSGNLLKNQRAFVQTGEIFPYLS